MRIIIAIFTVYTLPLFASALDDYDWINEMMYEFPGINNDFTAVTWAHAVNSQEKLKEALKGNVMFLEADVSIGQYTGDGHSGTLMPIMAHPPETTSDLTLQQFLDETLKSDKHIKLDFKTKTAFSDSEYTIIEAQNKHGFGKKIWLNADIIPGPINCSNPVVDANYFLSTCVTKFPDSIISVGWSTCYSKDNSRGEYTPKQIDEMMDALNRNAVLGSVTYAMRAGLAAQSIPIITNLMKTSPPDSTLTIWSSPGDPVDVDKLEELINIVGKDKVFVDIPSDLQIQLRKAEHKDKGGANSLSSVFTLTAILLLCSTSL